MWSAGASVQLSIVALLAVALLLSCCGHSPVLRPRYAPDQTAELQGWRITVHGLTALPADPLRQPTPGHQLYAVELTLENTDQRIRYVMPERQMAILDDSGRSFAPDYIAEVVAARTQGWTVPAGEIKSGQKAYGAASYQIPDSSRELRWVFCAGLLPWAPSVVFELGEIRP